MNTPSEKWTWSSGYCISSIKKTLLAPKIRLKNMPNGSSQTEQWKPIIFSDNNQLNLYDSDENSAIRCKKAGKFLPEFVASVVKFSFCQKVWACILQQEVHRLNLIQESLNAGNYLAIRKNKLLKTMRDHFSTLASGWTTAASAIQPKR